MDEIYNIFQVQKLSQRFTGILGRETVSLSEQFSVFQRNVSAKCLSNITNDLPNYTVPHLEERNLTNTNVRTSNPMKTVLQILRHMCTMAAHQVPIPHIRTYIHTYIHMYIHTYKNLCQISDITDIEAYN